MTKHAALARNALFISHATPEDNHFVRWLGAKLTAMGYEVWADVMRLRGGADWSRELEVALRQRAVKMLLVCTANGLEKQGVRNEIEIGSHVASQLSDSSFIIPLRLESYEAPFRIAQAQYIDFKGGWSRGLIELTALLGEMDVPRGKAGAMRAWLDTHSAGSARLLARPEPMLSNWLEVSAHPAKVFYCEPLAGVSLERFQQRQLHAWPVVPHRTGVVSFSVPDEAGSMGVDLPGKEMQSLPTDQFLDEGWAALGIEAAQARNFYTDLGSQAFDRFCTARSLKSYSGSGKRVSWWGDIKTAPISQVRFDWGFRRGARQIIGQSEKRGVHWHYALNAQLRTAPLRHIRLAARLVFSENGLDAIDDTRRAHVLRRSLAKSWRNARWRDMLCAFLWWLSNGKAELCIPVASEAFIQAQVPPMPFSSPVSVADENEEIPDEDDPDLVGDEWDDEMQEEIEE